MSNNTSIKYNQAVVPACHRCNSEVFSSLEKRIRENTAELMDYYLWALKISYALSYKDTTLPIDRSDRSKGTLIPKSFIDQDADVVYKLFSSLSAENFMASPNPFGSVFILNKTVDKVDGFFMVHVPAPYRALAITLPDRIAFVLFGDRGVVQQLIPISEIVRIFDKFNDIRLVLFHILRTQNYLTIPSGCFVRENAIVSEPLPSKFPLRKQKQAWYEEMANYCGLPIEFGSTCFANDKKRHLPKFFQLPTSRSSGRNNVR
ncbi:hypothetical protein [Photobacterium sp. J15]|uniref:hypothetical protein n=1 Tax=Photobacterium sp. J15 TaxID=265901 RepID=UPI0012EED7E0|nr:hypothetical protein [Photobacterium sp. J15]